jgi:hypothetical protein
VLFNPFIMVGLNKGILDFGNSRAELKGAAGGDGSGFFGEAQLKRGYHALKERFC